VNHATETIATLDTSLVEPLCRRDRWTCRVGRSERLRSVRSVDVVMIHEDRGDSLEMCLIQDQQPIQAF
jgi:hypothetical protein